MFFTDLPLCFLGTFAEPLMLILVLPVTFHPTAPDIDLYVAPNVALKVVLTDFVFVIDTVIPG